MSTSTTTSTTAPIRRATDPSLEWVGYPGRWRALPVLLVATFMALFDLFVVNVAAPSIQSSLHSGTAALELVVGGYSFTYAAGMVIGGRLGDLHGHRRLFVLGMAAFAIASALCGLSTTPGELVVARLAQGAAAAMMVPQVLAAITAIFPANERARALSWFGLTIGLGAVAGQVLGGALLRLDPAHLGWRVIFLVNVPIGAVVAPLAWKLLPHTRSDKAVHIDVIGAIGSSATVGLALIPLVLGRTEHWPLWTWMSFALVAPAAFALITHQRRLAAQDGQPLLDLQLFKSRTFAAGSAVNATFFAGFGGFILALTLALQAGWHLTPLATGMTYLPLGIAFATASMLGRGLTAKYGARGIVRAIAVSISGYVSLLTLLLVDGVHTTPLEMALPLALVGVGNGLTIPSLIGSVLATINPLHGGIAAGMLSTAQQFAAAAGVALTGVVFFGVVGTHLGRHTYVDALSASVVTTALLTLVAFGIGWLLPARLKAAKL